MQTRHTAMVGTQEHVYRAASTPVTRALRCLVEELQLQFLCIRRGQLCEPAKLAGERRRVLARHAWSSGYVQELCTNL